MPKLAAGILLYRLRADRHAPEVLLVLPRSARESRSGPSVWSIPKGKPMPSERLIDAARREFEEETARPAPTRLVELGEVVESNGKRVAVWAADAAWSGNHDARYGDQPAPDVAEVAWFEVDQAQRVLRPGQVPLIRRLDRLVSGRD